MVAPEAIAESTSKPPTEPNCTWFASIAATPCWGRHAAHRHVEALLFEVARVHRDEQWQFAGQTSL